MVLIRLITLVSLKENVRFFAHHVVGKTNKIVDNLSRNQLRLPIQKGPLKLILDEIGNSFGRKNQPYLSLLYQQ